MEETYVFNDYVVEHGARAASISEEVQKVLDRYVETEDVKVLEEVMENKPAHVIHVIYKESMRTFREDHPFENDGGAIISDGGNSFTTAFHTNYDLFDKDKIFWENDNELVKQYLGLWSFPITVWKRGSGEYGESQSSNFKTHNFFYPLGSFFNSETGLLERFYQDIDIMGDEDGWYKDLIKALYRVVLAVYWYWKKLNLENNDTD